MGGFLLNWIKPVVVWSIFVVNSRRMGVFLVYWWASISLRMGQFSDPVATHPRINEVEVPPPPPSRENPFDGFTDVHPTIFRHEDPMLPGGSWFNFCESVEYLPPKWNPPITRWFLRISKGTSRPITVYFGVKLCRPISVIIWWFIVY